MALSYENLRIDGYGIKRIEKCQIQAHIGNHASLKMTALLDENYKDEIIHTTKEYQDIQVYTIEKEEKLILFHGIITAISVEVQGNNYKLELQANSYTYLMDITKHSRSFQNINMTFHQLINQIMKSYTNAKYILKIPDYPIGELIVQYEETDWAFIKRIASLLMENIFPAMEFKGIYFVVGIQDTPIKGIKPLEKTIKKNLDDYYHMKAKNIQEISEADFITYIIETDTIERLGHYIKQQGQNFYVKKLNYVMEKGLLKNTYEYATKTGLKRLSEYPMHLIGTALPGKILSVKGDKVNIHLEIDEYQNTNEAYWFSYSTLSASGDGSGWYCMPEEGDRVMVCFPTKYTKDAFAISSVSLYDTSTTEDRMANPDVKYLRTVHDKEVKLAPDGIRIACNGSTAVLNIGKSGGVALHGQKSINVTAEENLIVTAKKELIMTALEEIQLACDKGGQLTLDTTGNILIKGTEVKLD